MTNTLSCAGLTKELSAELRVWLSNATRGLGRIGITRVVEDIGAHHREAYRKALGFGLKEDDARRKAMDSLGQPEKACRRFSKIYLTEAQENRLRWDFGKPTPTRFRVLEVAITVLAIGVVLVFFQNWFGSAFGEGIIWRLSGITGIFFLAQVFDVFSQSRFHRRQISLSVLCKSISGWLYLCYMFFLVSSLDMTYIMIFAIISTLIISLLTGSGINTVLIMRKLPKQISERDMRLLQCLMLQDEEIAHDE